MFGICLEEYSCTIYDGFIQFDGFVEFLLSQTENVYVRSYLVYHFASKSNSEKILEYYNQGIVDDADLYIDVADYFYITGRIKCYRKAVELGSLRAQFYLGNALMDFTDDFDAGLDLMKQAADLGYLRANVCLASRFQYLGDYELSSKYAMDYIDVGGVDYEIVDILSENYKEGGNRETILTFVLKHCDCFDYVISDMLQYEFDISIMYEKFVYLDHDIAEEFFKKPEVIAYTREYYKQTQHLKYMPSEGYLEAEESFNSKLN